MGPGQILLSLALILAAVALLFLVAMAIGRWLGRRFE